MKILWVKADKLLPVQSGGNIRTYHLARHVASHHDLTFLSYYPGARDAQYEAELNHEFPGAVPIATGTRAEGSARRGLDYVRHLPSRAPYAVSRFANSQVRTRLAAWYRERRFDVALCDFLDAAVNLPAELDIPTVLFQHNVETEIWRRHVLTEPSQVKRLFYGIEFMKMLSYERRTVARFAHVIAVSEHDRTLMTAWTDGARITVVPTGVDLARYRPSAEPGDGPPVVVFVGAMDWDPNVDAVEYFVRDVWPTIQARIPEVRFRIVGRNPVARVQELASESVEVTGSVPSVIEHLQQAAAVVVPLRVGGGTRLKIYEAMAAAKAVISTSVGAEGLDVHSGRDILLADTAPLFAEAVIAVLRDRELRNRLGKAAAARAALYDWPVVAARFREVLERITREAEPREADRLAQARKAGV